MNISNFEEEINRYLKNVETELNKKQIEMFYTYMNELIEWNNKINLTSIVEPKEIILKHFIDSIVINKYIKGKDVLDIGTGAGFPGIPLKIYMNELNVTLLDSLNKRIIFLDNIISKLSLDKVIAIHERAEEMGQNEKYREKYDIVTSRAVANLEVLIEYMIPFTKIGGECIIMKGQTLETVNNLEKKVDILGGKIKQIIDYKLPLTDIRRKVIIIKKIKSTPKVYPRKMTKIKKQ